MEHRQQQNRQKRALEEQHPELVCPRCNSNKTKFCYYNNHSTLQPRYFCRDCRRHWTAGGRLRDIPEGGTKRGKRNSSRGRTFPFGPSGMDDQVQVIAGDVSTDQNFIFMMQSLVATSGNGSSSSNRLNLEDGFRDMTPMINSNSIPNQCGLIPVVPLPPASSSSLYQILYGYSSTVQCLAQQVELNWCQNLLMVQQVLGLVQQRTNAPPPLVVTPPGDFVATRYDASAAAAAAAAEEREDSMRYQKTFLPPS